MLVYQPCRKKRKLLLFLRKIIAAVFKWKRYLLQGFLQAFLLLFQPRHLSVALDNTILWRFEQASKTCYLSPTRCKTHARFITDSNVIVIEFVVHHWKHTARRVQYARNKNGKGKSGNNEQLKVCTNRGIFNCCLYFKTSLGRQFCAAGLACKKTLLTCLVILLPVGPQECYWHLFVFKIIIIIH